MVLLKLQGPGESFVLICFVVGWPHRPCKTKWLAGWSSRLKSTTLTALCIGTTSDLYSFTSTSTRKERCAINGNINTEQLDHLQTRTDHVYTHIRTCLEVFETLKCYLELKGIEKRRRVIQDCNIRDLYFSHTAILHHFTLGGKFRESPYHSSAHAQISLRQPYVII